MARPLASLVARLVQVAKHLAPGPQQEVSSQRPGRDARPPPPTQQQRRPPLPPPAQQQHRPPLPPPTPTARACAVIGCKRPHRSQGYCAAHYQKRRLMLATGRLHAAWVENAAPHSIPEVILPRGRRPRADAAPTTPAPAVAPAPRMWVRKKGATGADGTAGPGAPTPARQPNASSEQERAKATVQRWASEFRSGKRRA
ncbi:cell wall protein [Myxococcus qinghaiensis]|uniref:cell wall protein n=1 Tax=Myxococcus qinghaiensis TaxID=2906758 RepID=UPI002B212D5F|nr:cell wall protein [Myxococcus qinghaiensis]